jgi:hypothetical protein
MKPMGCVLIVSTLLLCLGNETSAQFKGQIEREAQSSGGLIAEPSGSLFFGWFDPNRFTMRHTFDISYQTLGGQGMSLGTYTNSMMYQFADNLDARADVSMSFSPNNSFSTFGAKGKDFSGIYLSRAQVNYRPWENVSVQLQYRQIPYGSYYYSPFYHPMFGEYGY